MDRFIGLDAHLSSCTVAVVGPSGSGKSSAVKAGLLPAIRRGALPGSEKWFIVEMLPGTGPLVWEDDVASRMVDDVDRFLLAELEKSVARRARHWHRDVTSPLRARA